MDTTGIVAGSFDLITRGHEWLILEASRLVKKLHVVVGRNPAKRYRFSGAQRMDLVKISIADLALLGANVEVHFLDQELLVHFAARHGATHLIRGIRNAQDLQYETDMALVNRKIDPRIKTVFLPTPPELTQVSSSTVSGLVGFADWENIVSEYVHPAVIQAFREDLARRS